MEILEKILLDTVTPSQDLIEDVRKIEDDVVILGVSGKMGITLAKLLRNAFDEIGSPHKVYGIARFTNEDSRKELEDAGVETVKADFLNESDLKKLPKTKYVIFMVGYKFGASGNEPYTWAVNSYLPGRICEYYRDSNIVAFSTGCVYPLVPLTQGSPSEEFPPDPLGEYAQSCLGRERMFEYFSKENQTPVTIFRLNYAIDVKYGVLSELARSILAWEPVDVSMGYVNVIWQKDACEYAIRSLLIASVPANIVNVTGPETLSVRWIAERLAEELDKPVTFTGEEAETALLNNASKSHDLFGYPKTGIREMIRLTVQWLLGEGEVIDKPTHFQERKGEY